MFVFFNTDVSNRRTPCCSHVVFRRPSSSKISCWPVPVHPMFDYACSLSQKHSERNNALSRYVTILSLMRHWSFDTIFPVQLAAIYRVLSGQILQWVNETPPPTSNSYLGREKLSLKVRRKSTQGFHSLTFHPPCWPYSSHHSVSCGVYCRGHETICNNVFAKTVFNYEN